MKHSNAPGSAAPGVPIGAKDFGAIGSGDVHVSPHDLENIRSTGSIPAGEMRRLPNNDVGVQTKDRKQNRSRQDSPSSGRLLYAGQYPCQPLDFHRGAPWEGRGGGSMRGGGAVHPHPGAGGGQGTMRGRSLGGFQPGRTQPGKKETLKFVEDYDFEKANDTYKDLVDNLK